MAVQAFGEQFAGNGHEESFAAFKSSHEANSTALLNLAEGKKTTEPRPPFDPNSPDNAWPLMVHHAAKGELTVGKNLKGVEDPRTRKDITQANEAALAVALKSGYRREPYIKPQVPVLDPAAEKAALLRRIQEQDGLLNQQTDLLLRMEDRLKAVEQK